MNITRAAFRGKLRLIIPGMAVANSVILQAVHATTYPPPAGRRQSSMSVAAMAT